MNGKPIELRDGDAMEILADLWRKSNGGTGENDGEINGGDLVELVGGLLVETGRPLIFTPATPENMRKFIELHESDPMPPVAKAISLNGPEECAASPGDYFDMEPGEVLRDEDREPMILVVESKTRGLRDALTGVPVHVEHP